jgi:Na+-transporting NADH:ubiquinone oxidoreductase subunit NqrB
MNMNVLVSNNKSLVSGLFGAIALKYITIDDGSVFRFYGRNIPVWFLGGILGIVGSISTDTISTLVLPHISKSAKLQHLESIVLHVVSSSALFSFVPKLMNNDLSSSEMKKFAITGLVTELASQFVHEMSCKKGGGCENDTLF